MSARSWELVIPAPVRWLNANHRQHRMAFATDVRAWRHAAAWRAKKAGLPTGLDRVHVRAELHFTDARRRDAHNFYPTLKAAIDGLVDARLVVDDNARHLDGPDIRMGEPVGRTPSRPWGCLVLTVTEVVPRRDCGCRCHDECDTRGA